jgi:hypothetical protein
MEACDCLTALRTVGTKIASKCKTNPFPPSSKTAFLGVPKNHCNSTDRKRSAPDDGLFGSHPAGLQWVAPKISRHAAGAKIDPVI